MCLTSAAACRSWEPLINKQMQQLARKLLRRGSEKIWPPRPHYRRRTAAAELIGMRLAGAESLTCHMRRNVAYLRLGNADISDKEVGERS